jgi:hypothetical protein
MRVAMPRSRNTQGLEQLLESIIAREDVRRGLEEARRLRGALPDRAQLAHAAQPLLERMAAARADLPIPETPAFLQEGLDRLNVALGRKKRSPLQRFFDTPVPLWVALVAGAGALCVGMMLAKSASRSRMLTMPIDQLEAAADEIKGRWPAVHDDDIRDARGDLKKLTSIVVERTGENPREVRERLAAITSAHSPNGHS